MAQERPSLTSSLSRLKAKMTLRLKRISGAPRIQTTHGTIPFSYAPLDPDQREIRLLKIHKGAFDSPVKCSVIVCSLNDKPKYNSLSYTWGNAENTAPVTIDGRKVLVTVNLEIALRHLRDHKNRKLVDPRILPLWVDAICINQHDFGERNHQVRLMRDIYANASQVIAWLGQGDDHTDWVFKQFNCKDQKQALVPPDTHTAFDDLPTDFKLAIDIIYVKIMTRSWWTRVWVIEEVVLAKSDPVIICGYSSAIWEDFIHTLDVTIGWAMHQAYPFWDLRYQDPEINSEYMREGDFSMNAFQFRELRQKYLESDGVQSSVILMIANRFRATDPRDYVYGCLSILNPSIALMIDVDYNEQPFKIFQDAMRAIIDSEPTIFFQRHIQDMIFDPADGNSPCWVPDLSKIYDRVTNGNRGSALGLESNRLTRRWRHPSVSLLSNPDIMRISGILLDTISKVAPLSNFKSLESEQLFEIESMARTAMSQPIEASDRLHTLSHLRTQSHIIDIFTSTLIGDFTNSEKDALWEILMRRKSPEETLEAFSKGNRLHHLKRCISILGDRHNLRVSTRTMLISKAGFVGIGSWAVEKGDMIAFLFGMTMPLILRPRADGKGYSIVSWAYVSGLMNLDVLEEHDSKKLFTPIEATLDIY
jgi:Heterokaryon incompatibility protein (HET)